MPTFDVQHSKWFAGVDTKSNHFDVGTMNNDDWSAIMDKGQWQGVESLHLKCWRAVGYIRIVPGCDSGACAHEDPFFLIVNVVTAEMGATTPAMQPTRKYTLCPVTTTARPTS